LRNPDGRLQALIFDVDGTLADTEEAHRIAFNRAFAHFGLGWTWDRADYRRLLETTGGKERILKWIAPLQLADAERQRLQALVPALHAEKTRHYGAILGDGGIPLRDGVARLCDEALAAGVRLAIATTTTAANVQALLDASFSARIRQGFGVIACGDEVAAKKPAPDIFHLALARLGLDATQAVAFEDSENGLRAATAAGLWTVVTPNDWTEGSDFKAAGLLLPRLGDPDAPLPGEPGGRLRHAAWLTLSELATLLPSPAQRDRGRG
jgi:beta-phosphoglucomutase-like phosphatase (HAD superfamily)